MKSSDMVRDYVIKAVKYLPGGVKEDVTGKLTSAINEQIHKAAGKKEPTEKETEKVLKQFGPPSQAAAGFLSDNGNCLIGKNYYYFYKYVRKIALSIMTFFMILASVINVIVTKETGIEAITDIIFTIMSGDALAYSVVTVIFSKLQEKGEAHE